MGCLQQVFWKKTEFVIIAKHCLFGRGWQANNSFFDNQQVHLYTTVSHDEYSQHQYGDVIMSVMASQITSLKIFYPTVYSGADQRKHHSFTSLAFVQRIHRWRVNSPHEGPVTQKIRPFDDVIMILGCCGIAQHPRMLTLFIMCHWDADWGYTASTLHWY